MANRGQRKSRSNNRRQRNNKRNIVRTFSRAILFKPLRARVTNDPPPIPRTMTGSAIIPILVSVGDVGTPSKFEAGNVDRYSYLQLGKSNDSVLLNTGLTGADISNALFAWMQWTDGGLQTSWAVRRVALWGPNPLQGNVNYRDAEIGLRVDLGDISNSLELHDGGTTTRRPAVAISVPYSIWYSKPDTILVMVFPDAAQAACPLAVGAVWGKLYITLDWRRTPSVVLAASSSSAVSARQLVRPTTTTTTTTTPKTNAGR